MLKLTKNEARACWVLSKLKHNDEEIIDCKFNDFLLNVCFYGLHVDPIGLLSKIAEHHKTLEK